MSKRLRNAPNRTAVDSSRENALKLQAVLDTAVEGIITIDRRGTVHSFNLAAENIFGYRADELIGQNVRILMPSPYHEEHDGYLANYLETGEKKIIGIGREVEGRRKDGSTFPMGLAVSEVDVAGRRLFTGIVRDLTEQRQAEQALRESEKRYRDLFDGTHDLVQSVSPDGRFLFVNKSWKQLLGYSDEEIPNLRLLDIVHPDFHTSCHEIFAAVMRGEEVRKVEAKFVTKDGQSVEVEGDASPRFDNGQVVATNGFFRDIRERKRSEQSERLAFLGQMIAAIAHESRNNLQRIQAGVDMLRMDLEDNPEILPELDRIEKANDNQTKLHEELRMYAAPINLAYEQCDLGTIWRQAWANLGQQREKRDTHLSEEPTGVNLQFRLDDYRIEQVFRNLMENSLAACSDPVHISVRCVDASLASTPAVCIFVRDNGPGLTGEQEMRMFEPFYTTKRQGTGLGMAIARRIIEAHGGLIKVGDGQEGGAEFMITLPRSEL